MDYFDEDARIVEPELLSFRRSGNFSNPSVEQASFEEHTPALRYYFNDPGSFCKFEWPSFESPGPLPRRMEWQERVEPHLLAAHLTLSEPLFGQCGRELAPSLGTIHAFDFVFDEDLWQESSWVYNHSFRKSAAVDPRSGGDQEAINSIVDNEDNLPFGSFSEPFRLVSVSKLPVDRHPGKRREVVFGSEIGGDLLGHVPVCIPNLTRSRRDSFPAPSPTQSNFISSDSTEGGAARTPSTARTIPISIDSLRPLLPPPAGMNNIGIFKCDFEGCSAQPFQTQYLLSSHKNVHDSSRPHYCPIPECPWSEGGKGFKRKNELLRHSLVHNAPGYFCPFCPDRDHKYPRPDKLETHVRVHHCNKSKDDPLLRRALGKKPLSGKWMPEPDISLRREVRLDGKIISESQEPVLDKKCDQQSNAGILSNLGAQYLSVHVAQACPEPHEIVESIESDQTRQSRILQDEDLEGMRLKFLKFCEAEKTDHFELALSNINDDSITHQIDGHIVDENLVQQWYIAAQESKPGSICDSGYDSFGAPSRSPVDLRSQWSQPPELSQELVHVKLESLDDEQDISAVEPCRKTLDAPQKHHLSLRKIENLTTSSSPRLQRHNEGLSTRFWSCPFRTRRVMRSHFHRPNSVPVEISSPSSSLCATPPAAIIGSAGRYSEPELTLIEGMVESLTTRVQKIFSQVAGDASPTMESQSSSVESLSVVPSPSSWCSEQPALSRAQSLQAAQKLTVKIPVRSASVGRQARFQDGNESSQCLDAEASGSRESTRQQSFSTSGSSSQQTVSPQKRPFNDRRDQSPSDPGGSRKRRRGADVIDGRGESKGFFPCIYHIGEPEKYRSHGNRFQFFSQLLRHVRTTRHSLQVCEKCFHAFKTPDLYNRHSCSKSCGSNSCRRWRKRPEKSDETQSDRSDISDCACIVNSKGQWVALFKAKYPDQEVPDHVMRSLEARSSPEEMRSHQGLPRLGSVFESNSENGVTRSFSTIATPSSSSGSSTHSLLNTISELQRVATDLELRLSCRSSERQKNSDPDHGQLCNSDGTCTSAQQLKQQAEALESSLGECNDALNKEIVRRKGLEERLGVVWEMLQSTGGVMTKPGSRLCQWVEKSLQTTIEESRPPEEAPVPIQQTRMSQASAIEEEESRSSGEIAMPPQLPVPMQPMLGGGSEQWDNPFADASFFEDTFASSAHIQFGVANIEGVPDVLFGSFDEDILR